MANEYDIHLETKPGSPYLIEADDIATGKRANLNTCQYWVNGIPGICKYWVNGDPGSCSYEEVTSDGTRIYPSGWNYGHCDFLGRKIACDKYELHESGVEDLTQYMCIAPNPFLSGLYKEEDGVKTAVPKVDIIGYNEVEDIGRCDGCGLGKGVKGFSASNEGTEPNNGDYTKLPVVCPYYKPWHMGFGAIKPKTTDISKVQTDAEGNIIGDEREELEPRLPFSFKVYNLRAKLQKCAYWDKDYGSEFVYDSAGLYLEDEGEGDPFDVNERLTLCTCPDSRSDNYCTRNSSDFAVCSGTDMLLENVWSASGGVICNGAKPECPCYTGKWVYCVDDKLDKGDKISAQQIMELRFWMLDWASRDEYDAVFNKPPNKSDPSTADVYTYKRWERIGSTVDECKLLGDKVHMCVPVLDHEFDPNLVIQTSEVIYTRGDITAPDQRSFPNLVRDIETLDIPPLYITYPYSNKDPFDADLNPICGEQDKTPYIKRNCVIDYDEITVVGSTVRNTTIYVFNATIVGYGKIKELERYYNTLEIQTTLQKRNFNIAMDEFIDYLNMECSDLLYIADSNEDGLFTVGPVKLEYQNINSLIICAKLNDDWVFRRRTLWSQWHGGLVVQCDVGDNKAFEHKYEPTTSYVDDGYSIFTPSATACGRLIPLNGYNPYALSTEVGSLLNVNKTDVYLSVVDTHTNYSYCFKKILQQDIIVSRWNRVDNAGSIWIEIEDINLCYIYDWDIDKAELFRDDAEGNVIESVEMQKIFPSGDHTQENIKQNTCILFPADGVKRGFFKADGWQVKVGYWYHVIKNDNNITVTETIAHPDFSLANRFVDSNHTISLAGDNFSVTGITKDSVALLATFLDEEGRIISIMATKMCVDVARVFSRDVEISYGWGGDYKKQILRPEAGFLRVPQDGPFDLKEVGEGYFGSNIPCGDHEIGPFSGKGPMWYPYDSCDTIDYYDLWTGANWCVAPHENTPRNDYRFVGPERYIPTCSPHSTLWDCAEDWACGHYKLEDKSVRFTGYARKRGYVNVDVYRAFDWELPKFGNVLREHVERFKSIDNSYYISQKFQLFLPKYAWMPLVMDDTCLYFNFNCVDDFSINFINPLNFWLMSTDTQETIEEDTRYRFDEVFGIRKTILASYPPPIIHRGSAYPFVAYYHFKDDFMQWAWQEKWLDIERNSDEGLFFTSLIKPDYIYDMYKEEHRLIVDEGSYDIIYTAPTIDAVSKSLLTYPSIQLGTGPERWFEIIYDSEDDYDNSLVDWRDENQGVVDGSGGGSETSIYEVTTASGEWLHAHPDLYPGYNNMIYSVDAVRTPEAAEAVDRYMEISYDTILDELEDYVYNRGLIVEIYKDRLKYLPYENVSVTAEESYSPAIMVDNVTNNFPGQYNWYYRNNIEVSFEFTEPTCISKVVVKGYTGNVLANTIKYHLHQPEIILYEKSEGSAWSEVLATREGIYMSESAKKGGLGTSLWQEELNVDPTPLRMVTNRADYFKVKFGFIAYTLEGISVESIELYGAEYKDSVENIKIWERKLNVSIGDPGNYNLDGVNRVLSYEYNRDNSGIYFLEYTHPTGGTVRAYNKMRRVRGGEHKEDMEVIPTSDYDSVIEAEAEQYELYGDAYNSEPSDITEYTLTLPPRVQTFLYELFVSDNISGLTATMNSEKMRWENHPSVGRYSNYPLWHPGGHHYEWNRRNLDYIKCYLVGPFEHIMRLKFVHDHGNWSESAAIAIVSWYAAKPYYLLAKYTKDLITNNEAHNKLGDGVDLHNSPYQR